MDKAITTALLVIAGVICIMFIFNSVYPAVNRSSQAMVSMSETLNERMKSRINIVHAAGSADRTNVYIWVKNVGSTRIVKIEESDIFFGQEDDFARIPYLTDADEDYLCLVMPLRFTRAGNMRWKIAPTGPTAPR